MTRVRALCVALLLAACGHDTTSLDIQYRASGNDGQHTVRLPSHAEERFRIATHDLWVYSRHSIWVNDVTTFDAARIARIERGEEAIATELAFRVYSSADPVRELPATLHSARIEQAGHTRACSWTMDGGATVPQWTCPIRYSPYDITVRYRLDRDDTEYERTLHFEPLDFDHSVDNDVRLTIDGV
jgi:hypothetical protein